MINKIVVLSCVAVVLFLAGCGSNSTGNVSTTAQVKEAEKIVQGCLPKGKLRAIVKCVAPRGHEVQFEQCALKAGFKDLVPLRHHKLVPDIAKCLEDNR